MLSIYDLTVEYRENPIGIDCAAPRFSWKLRSDRRDTVQRSYQIHVTDEHGAFCWDSDLVNSARSVAVSYSGSPPPCLSKASAPERRCAGRGFTRPRWACTSSL